MAGMAIDGLASGLDTTSLINQLMQVEAIPQTLLKGKVTKVESFVSALQSLNSKVASLADVAKTASTAKSWDAVKASSTSTGVTVTAGAGAQASSLSFSVDKLATGQASLSGPVTTLADVVGAAPQTSVTLMKGTGTAATFTTIDLKGVTDLAGLAGAINDADTGVTATLVNIGGGQSRLQLSGTTTGKDATFELYTGAVTAATQPGATAILGSKAATTGPGNTVVSTAGDASVTLWKGIVGAEKPVTSSTNTFTDVVPGVSFTVTAVETDPKSPPVTLTVGRDAAAVKKLGSDLVTNLSTVLSEITSRTRSTTSKGTDGREVITGGVLSADSAVRSIKQSLLTQVSMPVDGTSPSAIGINLGKDGTVSFDEAKFTAALEADPANVESMLTEIAKRVGTVAQDLSDPTKGSLSLKIKNQQSHARSLNDQVNSWDNRLAMRRSGLEKTYSALEVSLSKLNSQSAWLTSQLASLTTESK
jgi:flagellar hook-associated protein 2